MPSDTRDRDSQNSSARASPKLIWSEQHWLFRAEEARTMLDDIKNPECRKIMSDIAETYARLATLTAGFHRAAGKPSD